MKFAFVNIDKYVVLFITIDKIKYCSNMTTLGLHTLLISSYQVQTFEIEVTED
jgi:hypothetical protein